MIRQNYAILFLIIVLILPKINADSTFFNNENDAFIIGISPTSPTTPATDSGTLGGSVSGGSRGTTSESEETSSVRETSSRSTLFDVSSEIIKSEIISGETLNAKVSLINLGVPGKVDVNLKYTISDAENNIILSQEEKRIVETQTEFIKTLELPLDIKTGEYQLKIDLIYLGQKEEAFSENYFQIISKEEQYLVTSSQTWIIIAGILIVLSVIFWHSELISLLQPRKKQFKWNKRDLDASKVINRTKVNKKR